MTPHRLTLVVTLAIVLALVAWQAPDLTTASDRGAYEATAEHFIVPDCSDLHCFRLLVAWSLGSLPGSSMVKWKTYAVVANLLAGVAVYALSIELALSPRAALMAAAMSALGFGSLYTLYDPFTSDPLMYAVGPFVTWLLLRRRLAAASVLAAIAVLAKEFAAAPMLMFAAALAMAGRFAEAARTLVGANWALIVWLVAQLTLIVGFNYSYSGNQSTQLLSGGYLAYWLSRQSVAVSILALFGELGMLWLLAPAGFRLATGDLRRLAIAAVPVALIFGYVQQPDRAFWNLHYLATPLAALVLDRVNASIAWATVGLYAAANVRLGAQLVFAPPSRISLVASLLLATACVFSAYRRPSVLA